LGGLVKAAATSSKFYFLRWFDQKRMKKVKVVSLFRAFDDETGDTKKLSNASFGRGNLFSPIIVSVIIDSFRVRLRRKVRREE